MRALAVRLRARLFLARLGAGAGGALLLCALAAAGWGAVLVRQAALVRLAARPAALPQPVIEAPTPAADPHLALFYDALGEQRYAEQQVATLFALAAKSGLSLNRGEYKFGYDQAGRMHTYQVTLPVKGAYRAIWEFCLQALAAIPFAALDEISFKRESIGDAILEARLRLTFYLKDPSMAEAR
jgi:hypothetical protein